MKTKEIKKDNLILVELRSVRDKISSELVGKSAEQIVEFLKQKKYFTHHPFGNSGISA